MRGEMAVEFVVKKPPPLGEMPRGRGGGYIVVCLVGNQAPVWEKVTHMAGRKQNVSAVPVHTPSELA